MASVLIATLMHKQELILKQVVVFTFKQRTILLKALSRKDLSYIESVIDCNILRAYMGKLRK